MTNITVILFILLTAITGLNAQENLNTSYSNIFEYKDDIAPFVSVEELLNNPTRIESYINPEKKDGVKVLDSLTDFHAVYDIPMHKLIKLVLDLENEQNVFPRMIYTADLNPDDPPWSPHLQEAIMSFKLGMIGSEYHSIFYKIPELREDGSFLIKWNLYESIDGNFDFVFGSWYMKEIFADGRKYTYVRNFAHYGIADYPTYVMIAIKIGGGKDSKAFLHSLRNAAE